MKKDIIKKILILLCLIFVFLMLQERTLYIEGKDSLNEQLEVVRPYLEATLDPTTPKSLDAGIASYYDYTLKSGWSSKGHIVCASRDYPRGSYLRVYYQDRFVVCKVTDYGPDEEIHPDRIIDLSSSAFAVLAPTKLGVIPVRVERIQ